MDTGWHGESFPKLRSFFRIAVVRERESECDALAMPMRTYLG